MWFFAQVPEPNALVGAFSSWGPMGLIAGIVLWLHHNAIKSFEEQMNRERESNSKALKDLMENHTESWNKMLDLVQLRLEKK